MPEASVRGVRINYVVIGDRGPWFALTPGSRRAFVELTDLARQIASQGYRVLLHDRRNCGASEVSIDNEGSEHEIWADDLRELCSQRGALPICVGGSSAGARLAILFAMRHPADVRALLLWRVTGGKDATKKLAQTYYGDFIEQVRAGGMEAVARSEHFAECIAARPGNRDRLLGMNPDQFVAVMQRWSEAFLAAADLPIIGATEEHLRAIKVPVCVIAGNDQIHPPRIARRIASLIPRCELYDDVVEKRGDDNLKEEWDRAEWRNAEPRIAEIFTRFLARMGATAASAA